MPTRKPKSAPPSARVHRGLAAALVFWVLGGCAQVLGLEEWKQADCEDVADDPKDCEEPVPCADCLFVAQAACQADQMACAADTTVCGPMLQCSQGCSTDSAPLDCIGTCCGSGNGLFDAYLTCQCSVCAESCGNLLAGCPDRCNEPPPPPP
ncbi:MAG: hypothetical protein HUU21_26625 [Polyangiaceae bacterium]|nr:hypothetical protein [Polyangiaceae bacterium]